MVKDLWLYTITKIVQLGCDDPFETENTAQDIMDKLEIDHEISVSEHLNAMEWNGAYQKYIDAENSPIINLCVNCALCTAVIYALSAVTSGIYIGRLPIYTTFPGYIAGVWIIDHMFMKESARIVKSILILSYLVFFYYQMHMAWGIL